MASTTGIELGPKSCLLAGVRPLRAGGAEVFALHKIESAEWPADEPTLVETLRTIRQRKGFPRRASVVAWDLLEDAAGDAIGRNLLGPIEAAGFRVVSVLTPPQALVRLAAERRRSSPDEAVAWLALNTSGAAIAIVRGTDLLFSRTFHWVYNPNLRTDKEQLLQRYTLIAHLAPELDRGIDIVRAEHGLSVALVVTCGNLPELRSLTMPLIEELDLEVETLDSPEGLRGMRGAWMERFAELAPALRLASASAPPPHDRARRESILPAVARIAAAVGLIATIAWASYSYWYVSPARPVHPRLNPQRSADRVSSAPIRPELHAPGAAAATSGSQPNARAPVEPAPLPVATQGRREPNRAPSTTEELSRRVFPQQPQPATADKGAVTVPSREARAAQAVPLKEPLPKIDTVLIDQDRRLALADGAVVGIGDSIGSRVVVAIARDAVVLREPSGRTVRVPLRARVSR